jgi:hypothetical protein
MLSCPAILASIECSTVLSTISSAEPVSICAPDLRRSPRCGVKGSSLP